METFNALVEAIAPRRRIRWKSERNPLGAVGTRSEDPPFKGVEFVILGLSADVPSLECDAESVQAHPWSYVKQLYQ